MKNLQLRKHVGLLSAGRAIKDKGEEFKTVRGAHWSRGMGLHRAFGVMLVLF